MVAFTVLITFLASSLLALQTWRLWSSAAAFLSPEKNASAFFLAQKNLRIFLALRKERLLGTQRKTRRIRATLGCTNADNGMIGACGGPFSFSRERKAPWDQKKEAGDSNLSKAQMDQLKTKFSAWFQSPKTLDPMQIALDPSPIQQPFFLAKKERLLGTQRKKRSGFQPLKNALAVENLGSRPLILNTISARYNYGQA